MGENYCRCPGCGECGAHANAPKLKAEIKRLKSAAQRQWVGLTQQDIDIAFDDTQEGGGFDEFARAIEAKLRERNGDAS